MITKEMLTNQDLDITGLKLNDTFYYVDYIDIDEEYVLAIPTDEICTDDIVEFERITFDTLVEDKNNKLYMWKEV